MSPAKVAEALQYLWRRVSEAERGEDQAARERGEVPSQRPVSHEEHIFHFFLLAQ